MRAITCTKLHVLFCAGLPTQVSDDLLDHVFEHASAVLWMKEREKLLLIQQLVSWRVISLEPAILQTFQNLLGCGNTTHQPTFIIVIICMRIHFLIWLQVGHDRQNNVHETTTMYYVPKM